MLIDIKNGILESDHMWIHPFINRTTISFSKAYFILDKNSLCAGFGILYYAIGITINIRNK
jgi:hypothetical protein